ncbi:MAG: prolyl oligopeptidase family serine peptidase, partial [Planctomycetes bacterium]|nr:prolyl oligopeptidase family serine peptidase [Planctomycetota bacterium]
DAPWASARGLVVRGFRSQIDDSVQPYGLVIPEGLDTSRPCPLYVWLHGRGDTTTDLAFIYQRQTNPGQISPSDAIVLHPFGRYCNAFKFAGETDVFEAVAAVQRNYRIDPSRIVLWGFSMGGAGTWHLGAHYPDRWVAMSPGAGFAETRRYQRLTPERYPAEYVQTLWRLYDVPDYVRNLFNLPLFAYSGEMDPQMQAARIMEEAFAEHGRKFPHLIGPGMGHRYHPDTLAELTQLIKRQVDQGRPRYPEQVTLQTRTLRYNRCDWVEVLALDEHWQDTRVDARWVSPSRLEVATRNVAALRLQRPPLVAKGFEPNAAVVIDGQEFAGAFTAAPGGALDLEKIAGRWQANSRIIGSELRKLHGLQGPIDDVFFEPFLVVLPSGKSSHPHVEQWAQDELAHFQSRWRGLFRGDVRSKRDDEVTEDDMQRYHLILWGDSASNSVIAKVAEYLPIAWSGQQITAGNEKFAADGHVLTLIHPNPLQQRPTRYVVLNSGPTFREAHDRTNSQQTAKLPDWAVIDLSEPPGPERPGRIAAAGFFDEQWRLKLPGAGK